MKHFRIYYQTIGVTAARPQAMIVRAADAEAAAELFKLCRPWSNIIAIFAE